ncbi:fibropellin-1-like [Mya arenaria]|uniref:fibropellin-1-like n=1 Tax=Mya arenaria TaxID=6604 RepID=UPI0022E34109|nr:fibropellin-1-like [Mya arenaria]
MAFGCVSFHVICTALTVLSSVTTNAVATSPDPCMLHPCVHGACFSSGSIFICQCPPGYTGTRCETAATTPAPCSSNPCLHGSCANHGSSYTCSCTSGYTGTNCDKAGPVVCLKCSSTIGAAECTTVETCGPHEVCFSDAYSTTTGIRREYGCRDSQLCASNQVGRRRSSSGGLLACTQCCQGDMCNSKLCGENGVQLNGGPTCFACDQFQDPGACNQIQHCGRDEICELLPDLSTVTHSNLYTSRCAKPQTK